MRGFEVVDDNGSKLFMPLFYVCQRCRDFVETVPALERDERNWEDIDSAGIDHIADECRYVLSSRFSSGMTYEDYVMRWMFRRRCIMVDIAVAALYGGGKG